MDEIFLQMLLDAETPIEISELPIQPIELVSEVHTPKYTSRLHSSAIVSQAFPEGQHENINKTENSYNTIIPKKRGRKPLNSAMRLENNANPLEGLSEDVATDLLIKEVKKIRKPKYTAKKKNSSIEVIDFDKSMNILDTDVRYKFKNEIISPETAYLSSPKLTTATLSGGFANIKMHESDWIKDMVASKYLLLFRCNFGEVVYDKYIPPPRKEKKKKNNDKKTNRKKQGTGTEFNSQITIYVNAEHYLYTDDDIIPSSVPVFKFKIFRNGRTQLPGGDINLIDNVVSSAKNIESYLNRIFFEKETELCKLIMIININICMKNYKFSIALKNTQLINLERIRDLYLEYSQSKDFSYREDMPLEERLTQDIAISDIIPNGSFTNLSIVFKTPIYSDPEKTMRMTIEKGGKVNIKGALYIEYSRQCFYLLDKFLKEDKHIILDKYKIKPLEYNVPEITDFDSFNMLKQRLLAML
jgi:hypothetical protein